MILLALPVACASAAVALVLWKANRKGQRTRNQNNVSLPTVVDATKQQLYSLKGLADIQRVLQDGMSAHAAAKITEEVEVHDAALAYFPPLLTVLTNLTKLDLAKCSMCYLPFSVSVLLNVKHLSVSGNQLRCLPAELCHMTALHHLDSSHNQISTLPDSLCHLSQLQLCNVLGNQLSSLPADIGNLRSLRLFGLKSNKLSSLPASFSQLTSLVELFLTDNCLTHFPQGFGQLVSLVKLQASFNRLEDIPAELGDLPRLELMRVAVCNISSLPDCITSKESGKGSDVVVQSSGWSSLAWFSLGGNPACAHMPAPRLGLSQVKQTTLQLGDKLGDGASGEVLRAVLHDQEVAVKFFRADVSPDGRTAEEVAIACAVDHPCLTRVLATIRDDAAAQSSHHQSATANDPADAAPIAALVMQICHGKPMAAKPTSAHLLRCKWDPSETMSCAFIVRVASDVASALAYLHSLCICHGDVYAHNILVDTAGNATLCDFGASFCYEQGQRAFWEAMEVRAFGLFLNDVAHQVCLEGPRHKLPEEAGRVHAPTLQALRSLSRRCLNTQPLSRPTFTELTAALASMGSDV